MFAHGSHDSSLVALSILIATAASYTALDLGGRIRAAVGKACYGWLLTAAIAMGGGIWSMHFVAMLAFSLPGVVVGYDIGLTLFSLFIPIVVTGLGFFVVGRKDAGLRPLATSGVLMGLGIVAMHYTGMAAMRMPADLSYDPVWVALSVFIAIGASIVALWLAFRNTDLLQRIFASVVMGLAISGMHYTAMHAARFQTHGSAQPIDATNLGQSHLAVGVATATFLILFLALVAAIFDRRFAMLAGREAAALRESERRFRLLVEGVTEYAIFMLDPLGRVTNWNSGAERIKGYRADEIIGQHFSRFYSEEDRRNGEPERALRIAREKGKFSAEGWRIRKDGSRFWASAVIDAIYDETGQLLGFAKVTRDLTERKDAQRRLEEAQARILQAQKMEAVGQLTGGIAHDFNNLLAVVLGNLELLRKRVSADASGTRLLENAYKGAQRGVTLTERMLAFARRQELRPAAVDMPDLVRGMADLLERTIGPGVRVETRFPVQLARAHVDANQLELAILNLAVNARDAMPQGGSITVAADEQNVVEESNALGLRPGAYIRLRVVDTGTGMNDATLARATEPFFTTKRAGRGTGLGLSMVHGLAEQSGGCLMLKSRPGEGTTAEIWLPVTQEDQSKQVAAPLTKAKKDEVQERLGILVVDDDELVLDGTSATLQDLGHTVFEAASGRDALSILSRGERIDLVITDQVMPEMSGIELSATIKARWPHIPIILMTGYAEEPANLDPDLLKLTKPFSQSMLSWAVAECTRTKRSSRTVVAFRQR
jgi:PAS domain S-box-containing protein